MVWFLVPFEFSNHHFEEERAGCLFNCVVAAFVSLPCGNVGVSAVRDCDIL